MRFVSWNVNGLRSTEKDFLSFIEDKQPDLLMLQEIRAHPSQLSFFLKLIPDYEVEFNHSGRPGYGGTALYYKKTLPLDRVSKSSGNTLLDSEGRTIFCRLKDLYIFNFYTPNGNSSKERLNYKMDFYKSIKDHLRNLIESNKPVVVGGDLNVAHTELDLHAPKTTRNSGFLPEEREWFKNLLKIGFIDSFRMFEKGGGHYTWWHLGDPKREKNRGWRFDYFLISNDIKSKVRKSEILKDVFGSDHCPIMLELDI